MSIFFNSSKTKYLSLTLLGFASGLPYMLIFSTLATWLAVVEVDIKTIGFFAWVVLTYSLKVFWAPLIDNFSIPFLRKLGKRTSWIITSQLLIIIGLVALSNTDPETNIELFAFFAFLVALFGSFNDIAVDAYRIELADINDQGYLAAGYQLGYRIAMLFATSGALIMASRISWESVYLIMAYTMFFGIIAVFITKEKVNNVLVRSNLIYSFINPLKDFYKRFGLFAASILLVIIGTYRLTDIVSGQITNVFYIKMGFSLDEIALVVKTIALGAAIIGFYLGTFILKKLNMKNALLVGAFLVMATNLFFAYVAISEEKNIFSLSFIVAMDSIAAGAVGTINITFLTSLVSKKFTAVQYALLTSVMTLFGKLLSGFSGVIINNFKNFIFNNDMIYEKAISTILINKTSQNMIANEVTLATEIIKRIDEASWMPFYITTSILALPSIFFIIFYFNKLHKT